MSETIFKWCPHLIDSEYNSEFRVQKSDFELPIVQKRLMSAKGLKSWKFNYKTRLFNSDAEYKKLQDEIFNFHEARYGGYDNFWLPSFELETKAVSVSASSITLNMDATQLGFTSTLGNYGNYIYICNRLYTIFGTTGYYENICRITSISGTGNITLNITPSITAANYAGRPYIMKACKANFLNDKFTRAFDNPFAWNGNIEFIQDLSESFVIDLL